MKSTAAYEGERSKVQDATSRDEDGALPTAEGNISSLRDLTLKLLRKVQSIGEVPTLEISSGVDFYDEVTRFEMDLIRRALVRTGGHQRRAARLLNLKVTTLNSKIKHYNIRLGGDYYPLTENFEMEMAGGNSNGTT